MKYNKRGSLDKQNNGFYLRKERSNLRECQMNVNWVSCEWKIDMLEYLLRSVSVAYRSWKIILITIIIIIISISIAVVILNHSFFLFVFLFLLFLFFKEFFVYACVVNLEKFRVVQVWICYRSRVSLCQRDWINKRGQIFVWIFFCCFLEHYKRQNKE